jgi:RimJ/RimL family protein N-acetyltransferase
MAKKCILKNGLEVNIRQISENDAERVLCLINSIASERLHILMTPEDLRKMIPDIEAEKNWIRDYQKSENFMLVAECRHKIIGCISVKAGQMSLCRHVATLGLSVIEAYRGFGLGKTLSRFAIEWCQKEPAIEKLSLSVFADNTTAIRLYKKLDFIEEGRQVKAIKRSPGKYVDCIMMYLMV